MITVARKILLFALVSTSIFATDMDDSEIINDIDFFMAMEIIEDHSNLIEEESGDDSSKDSSINEEESHES
jgi:hypothetical protein